MDIYESFYSLRNRYGVLFLEIEKLLRRNKKLDLEKIIYLLREKGVTFDENKIFLILQNLIANEKSVIRHEYWNKSTEYELLDSRFWESDVQTHYYSFEDDDNSNKIYLLISDTHIGDDKTFNSKLLNNLYDYAIKNGAVKGFNIGDLFEGNQKLANLLTYDNYRLLDNFEEEFIRQLNIFINEFPKPNPNEFKTYSLLGNHDKLINLFLQSRGYGRECDLRKLSIYNPSFYMFPRTDWSTTLNGVSTHFSHKLYMNFLNSDVKINELNDIEKKKSQIGDLILDADYDLLLSGHLHKGIIYTGLDYFKEKNKLYLGVPSTSSINIGSAVGYLVYMYKESNSMEVSILGCDNDLNIYEIDRINWEFNKMNKTYSKTL